MISVDTTILKELTAIVSNAVKSIDIATEALHRVSIHNDWGCREKTAINNYSIQNKTIIKTLQENSHSFLNVITQVTNEFEDSEKSIISMFSSVESQISHALSIETGTSDDSLKITGDFKAIISEMISVPPKDWVNWPNDNFVSYVQTSNELTDQGIYIKNNNMDYLSSFTANNLTEPIPVCYFKDINIE